MIKEYLLNRLDVQGRVIKKNQEIVKANMEKIKHMNQEILDLKTSAKKFNLKKKHCDSCNEVLGLPAIHFMCGHSFHD